MSTVTAPAVESAAADDVDRRTTPRTGPSGWYALLGAVAAIGLWFLITDVLLASRPLVREFSPTRTWSGLVELWRSGVLLDDASASMLRLVAGLLIAVVIGVLVGLAIGSVGWLERATRPVVSFLRMVSLIIRLAW